MRPVPRARRRWAGAALLLAVGLAATAAPAGARQGEAATTGDDLRLVAQSTWVAEGEPFELALRVAGGLPAAGEVVLTLYGAVTSRDVLVQAPAATAELGPVRDTLSVPTGLVPRGRDGRYLLRIATGGDGPGLQVDDPGVYPLTVAVAAADGTTVDELTTFLVRPPADAAATPLRTAVVLPLHAPPSHAPDGTAGLADRTRQLLTVRSALLERHPDLAVTVAPTPETLEATAVVDPALARRVRRALADRSVVGGPYVRLDLASWAAVGDLRVPLDDQFDEGEATLERVLGRPIDDTTWVGDANPTGAAIDALDDVGVERAVVPLESVTGTVTPVTEPVVVVGATDQELPAVLADPTLTGAVEGTPDAVLLAHRLLATLAWLATPVADGGGAVTGTDDGVVVSLSATRPLPPAFLGTLFDALDGPPGPLEAVTLARLFEADPVGDPGPEPGPRVTGVPTVAVDLTAYGRNLGVARSQVGGFAAFAGRRDPRSIDLDRRLLVSGSGDLVADQRGEYLAAALAGVRVGTRGFAITDDEKVTLTSREGDIPVTLRNDTGGPVDVVLRFDSDNRLEFPDGSSRRLVLAEGATQIDVPVVARTSGSFPLRITATAPDGSLVVGRARLTVRSTAVSGVGIVLSVGALLVLAVWWGRHWHTTRRNRRLVDPT